LETVAVVALLAVLATLPGTLLLLVLSAGALFAARRRPPRGAPQNAAERVRLAIAVPAHDEERTIAECLRSLRASMLADGGDTRLVVVADHCGDATAEIASDLGVRVLLRDDASQRGKGFTLHHAWQALRAEPVDALAVVDADTVVDANFVREIRARLETGADAVQARNLVRNAGESMRTRLLSLGMLGMNLVRPLGREQLGCSVGVFGNGFAVRREVLERVPFTGFSVTEDLDFHIRLVLAGRRVRFVDSTSVWSDMPLTGRDAQLQRARWEGGRLNALRRQAPHLLRHVAAGRLRLLEPLADLLLLPLAYHAALLALLVLLPWTPGRILGAAGLAVLAFHVVLAAKLGRRLRDLVALPALPLYLLWKLALLRRIAAAARPRAPWHRTPRRQAVAPETTP
jgi:cellulose synthase/poly-beta-1,6-N-acetylglucosamine synthase-like glycosyltransferase